MLLLKHLEIEKQFTGVNGPKIYELILKGRRLIILKLKLKKGKTGQLHLIGFDLSLFRSGLPNSQCKISITVGASVVVLSTIP